MTSYIPVLYLLSSTKSCVAKVLLNPDCLRSTLLFLFSVPLIGGLDVAPGWHLTSLQSNAYVVRWHSHVPLNPPVRTLHGETTARSLRITKKLAFNFVAAHAGLPTFSSSLRLKGNGSRIHPCNRHHNRGAAGPLICSGTRVLACVF